MYDRILLFSLHAPRESRMHMLASNFSSDTVAAVGFYAVRSFEAAFFWEWMRDV